MKPQKPQTLLVTAFALCVLLLQSFVGVCTNEVFSQSGQPAAFKLQCDPEKTEDDGKYAGIIKYIGSQCYRQIGDAPAVLLDADRHQYADVHVGEKFQCFSGSMAFELKSSPDKSGLSHVIYFFDGCYTVKKASVGQSFFARGMRSSKSSTSRAGRSHHEAFCSPIDKTGVIASQLMMPDAVGSVLTLQVVDSKNRELWKMAGVEGASGTYELDRPAIEEVRKVLDQYRQRNSPNPLRLVIKDSKGRTSKIQFSLLTTAEEMALTTELNNCASDNQDVMLSLCRIEAFSKRQMFREVVQEYDVALKLAPKSAALISKSNEMRRLVGDAQCFRF